MTQEHFELAFYALYLHSLDDHLCNHCKKFFLYCFVIPQIVSLDLLEFLDHSIGNFIIIAKCTIFEIANDLKIAILPSKISFLICHSFIVLCHSFIVFIVFIVFEFSCYKNMYTQNFYTFYSQVDIFHSAVCDIYIFQNSHFSYFAFI